MGDNSAKTKVRRQRSISQVHFGFTQKQKATKMAAFSLGSPEDDIDRFEHQVAGHEFNNDKESVGLLKCINGTILKPVIKPDLGKREIEFYEQLESSTDPCLSELKEFVPKYHGTRTVHINGKDVTFLMLENLCADLLEPCVMDIKIGQRTWDPFASADKIKRESEKYGQSKRDLAFCIPGFQIFTLSNGELIRFGKSYGRTLDGQKIYTAIKTFLNFDGKGTICRLLIVQFLTSLWRLQKWARTQTLYRFYSTSLLIVYDTKGLRDCCGNGGNFLMQSIERRCSVEIHPKNRKISTGSMKYSSQTANDTSASFSGQLSSKGPVFSRISSTPTAVPSSGFAGSKPRTGGAGGTLPGTKSWHTVLNKLQRSHSFHNNYDDNLSKMKLSYNSILDDLVTDSTKKYKPWATIKLIDFSHTFTAEEKSPDFNFVQGINNVVKIFEHLLSEIESKHEGKIM